MKRRIWGSFLILFVFIIFIPSRSTNARKYGPYKRFVIKSYMGKDILCSHYIVRKGDHLWRILRLKGCLAREDFPRFIKMLKDLNPHIQQLERIYPNQRIIIPLKEIADDRFFDEGTRPRTITIPILPDIFYFQYEVSPGDTVIKVLANQYGIPPNKITYDDLENFKRLNPGIRNINKIYPHQRIRIPVPIPSKVYHVAAKDPEVNTTDKRIAPHVQSRQNLQDLKEYSKGRQTWSIPLVSRVINLVGGTLISSGIYCFPYTKNRDRVLDLSEFPVIEWDDGSRFLIAAGSHLSQETERAIRLFWKSMSVIRVDRNASSKDFLDAVFRKKNNIVSVKEGELFLDNGIRVRLGGDWILEGNISGVKYSQDKARYQTEYTCITLIDRPEECTFDAICAYLSQKNIHIIDILANKRIPHDNLNTVTEADRLNNIDTSGNMINSICISDQRTFVNQFLHEMGFSYTEDVPISFSYAGFEVNTYTNFLRVPHGIDVIIDFETLFGDAKSQIEASNLKVLTVRSDDQPLTIAENILQAINIPYKEDPVFLGADREVSRAVSITIPGLLISYPPQSHTLLTGVPFERDLYHFLKDKEIRVLKMDECQK